MLFQVNGSVEVTPVVVTGQYLDIVVMPNLARGMICTEPGLCYAALPGAIC